MWRDKNGMWIYKSRPQGIKIKLASKKRGIELVYGPHTREHNAGVPFSTFFVLSPPIFVLQNAMAFSFFREEKMKRLINATFVQLP